MTVQSPKTHAITTGPSRRALLRTGLIGGGLTATTSLLTGGPAAAADDLPGDAEATMQGNGYLEAGLPNSSTLGGTVWPDQPTGFASLPALGLDGTTGGAGGSIVHARTAAELRSFANASEALVVILHGSIVFDTYEKLRVQSNKSFLGAGPDAEVVNAGFKLINIANVIFRNFTVRDSYIPGDFEGKRPDNDRDGIQVDTSHHIWVDHMYFTRLGDGLVDTRKDCDYVTYSWNVFADHNKAIGEGWTENVVTQLTFHHNWIRNTHQRNASLDNVLAGHVYNNYLQDISSYGMLGRNAARLVVEGNYFQDVRNPLNIQDPEGELAASGNIFEDCVGVNSAPRGAAFDPVTRYQYRLDPAEAVPALVGRFAGPLGGTVTLPAEVITVALDGSGDYGSIRAAVGSIPSGYSRPVTIRLAPGVYDEPVVIWQDRSGIILEGSTGNAADVVLTFKEGVTLFVAGNGTAVRNLTVTSGKIQTGFVVLTTGEDVSYENVTVLNGRHG